MNQHLESEPKSSTTNYPKFIHFFGPDGAGKSTQVEILVKNFRRKGIKTQMCWVRAHHTLAFLLWRLLVRIGFYRMVRNPLGYTAKLPAVNKNSMLRHFWTAIELFGVLPVLLRIYIKLWRGYTLVAERYVIDTVTTIAYFLDDLSFLGSMTSRFLLRLMPEGTAFVFLDSDYGTIYGRRAPLQHSRKHLESAKNYYGAIPRSTVEPKVFIEFQRKAYRILAKSFEPLVIDTSRHSVSETSEMITKSLGLNQ